MKEKDKEQGKIDYLGFQATTQQLNHTSDTVFQTWNRTTNSCFRITAGIIVCKSKGRSKYDIFFRMPLFWAKVLNCRIESSWPSWPGLSIYPLLRIQNIVSKDSSAIAACLQDDVSELRSLFSMGNAHPNDTALDNLTLLYVNLSLLTI